MKTYFDFCRDARKRLCMPPAWDKLFVERRDCQMKSFRTARDGSRRLQKNWNCEIEPKEIFQCRLVFICLSLR